MENENDETARLIFAQLRESNLPYPEVCVAEDGEIEFDWVEGSKEAILTISRKNKYSYLLKQPSGKFLSRTADITEGGENCMKCQPCLSHENPKQRFIGR